MTELQKAFRFHLQSRILRAYGDNRPRAVIAIQKAREDVASGKARYPAPIKGHAMRAGFDHDKPRSVYVENPESFGLRLVGRVIPECNRRNGMWDSRGDCGWHTDPHGDVFRDGTGLCYGLVYQLAGRKGDSRFVAGYQHGACDSGVLLDFSAIYAEPRGDYDTSPCDLDAAHDAARAADSMAQAAAEQEREYQTAWQAGSAWAQEADTIAEARQEALEILRERRAVKGSAAYPALCRAIRSQVSDLLDTITEARDRRDKLAQGEHDSYYFWTGETRLKDAFCEGAGLDSFPA